MRWLQNDMFACGSRGLPLEVYCNKRPFNLENVFKHDFFACTGLFVCKSTGERIVLKVSRLQPFFGISLRWLGHFLRNREVKLLTLLKDVNFVPELICTYGRNGLIYKYIEGKSLDEKPPVPDSFFEELEALLNEIHTRGICYMDLNKRGNILIGTDLHPYIIDFQISLCLNPKWMGFARTAFQKEDKYHFLKQKRQFRPDLMTAEDKACVKHVSLLIRTHRLAAYPFRQVRRSFLRFLYQKNILESGYSGLRTPENDPSRFAG